RTAARQTPIIPPWAVSFRLCADLVALASTFGAGANGARSLSKSRQLLPEGRARGHGYPTHVVWATPLPAGAPQRLRDAASSADPHRSTQTCPSRARRASFGRTKVADFTGIADAPSDISSRLCGHRALS